MTSQDNEHQTNLRQHHTDTVTSMHWLQCAARDATGYGNLLGKAAAEPGLYERALAVLGKHFKLLQVSVSVL